MNSLKKRRLNTGLFGQMKELVEVEEEILTYKKKKLPDALLVKAKEDGFSDRYLSQILGVTEAEIRDRRISLGKQEAWCAVPVSGADAAYYYSTYNAPNEVKVSERQKDYDSRRRTEQNRPGH